MSLKSNLSQGPVKDFMQKNFSNLRTFVRDLDTGDPVDWYSKPQFHYIKIEKYLLLGTAYDAYVRTAIAIKTQDKKFLADLFSFLNYLSTHPDLSKQYDLKRNDALIFIQNYVQMVQRKERIKTEWVIDLAMFDDIFRSCVSTRRDYIRPSLHQRSEMKRELAKFANHSSQKLFKFVEGKPIEHGKNFGKYSEMLGGADLDLITETEIIDMKTNKHLNYQSQDWHQIIAYSLLNKLLEPNTKVDKVYIYYARFDKMVYIDLNEIDAYNYAYGFRKVLERL